MTRQKLSDRRSNMLNIIAAKSSIAETSVWKSMVRSLDTIDRDVPLAIAYKAEEIGEKGRCILRLEDCYGVYAGHKASPKLLDINANVEGLAPYFREAQTKNAPVILDRLPPFLHHNIAWRGFGEPSRTIIVLPFALMGETLGFLALGLNSRRAYDKDMERFVQDLSLQCSTVIKARLDIDRMKAREMQLSKELSDTERFVRRMAEMAPVGMFHLSHDGMIKWANAKCKTELHGSH